MPPYPRVNVNGDPHAAGRGRQKLKLAAIGYASVRHGVDATLESARTARTHLCKIAIEYVATLPGDLLKNRRIDPSQGNDELLHLSALAYASARHGVDADVGMAREGLAFLCQASIDYVESLPREEVPKRVPSAHLHLGNGAA